jgi:hypothetical protein
MRSQRSRSTGACAQFTCFAGTNVHMLTQNALPTHRARADMELLQVLNLLALLVQRYTY